MQRFNYEVLVDLKDFLLEMQVKYRIVFLADDETDDGSSNATVKKGINLHQAIFPEMHTPQARVNNVITNLRQKY